MAPATRFCHIQLTAVLGSINKSESIGTGRPEFFCFFRFESFIKCRRIVSLKIVYDQRDFFSIGAEFIRYVLCHRMMLRRGRPDRNILKVCGLLSKREKTANNILNQRRAFDI
jgi:hypothetical protein